MKLCLSVHTVFPSILSIQELGFSFFLKFGSFRAINGKKWSPKKSLLLIFIVVNFLYEIRGPWVLKSIICWFSWKILAFPEVYQEIAKICFLYFLSKIRWDFDSEFSWFCTWWQRIKVTQKHSLFRFVLKILTGSILKPRGTSTLIFTWSGGCQFFFKFLHEDRGPRVVKVLYILCIHIYSSLKPGQMGPNQAPKWPYFKYVVLK